MTEEKFVKDNSYKLSRNRIYNRIIIEIDPDFKPMGKDEAIKRISKLPIEFHKSLYGVIITYHVCELAGEPSVVPFITKSTKRVSRGTIFNYELMDFKLRRIISRFLITITSD